jgi:SCO1/SenC
MNKSTYKINWILCILALLFLIPVVSAWLIYYQRDQLEFNTTSNGTLINPPFSMTMLKLFTNTGEAFIQESLHRKWLLLYLQPTCNDFCRTQLGRVQDSRVALGKDMVRVRTVLVTAPQENDEELQQYLRQNPDIIHLFAHHDAFLELNDYLNSDEDSIENNLIIVDPLGNAVIRYNSEIYSTVVYKDLQRLLKASQIG